MQGELEASISKEEKDRGFREEAVKSEVSCDFPSFLSRKKQIKNLLKKSVDTK